VALDADLGSHGSTFLDVWRRSSSVIREISRINERELTANVSSAASWHAQYKDSAYVYVGGLPYELNEGDIIVVFSQYGALA